MCSSVTSIEYYVQGIHMLDLPCRPHRPKSNSMIKVVEGGSGGGVGLSPPPLLDRPSVLILLFFHIL